MGARVLPGGVSAADLATFVGGHVLGPDQARALAELSRVLRPGGEPSAGDLTDHAVC